MKRDRNVVGFRGVSTGRNWRWVRFRGVSRQKSKGTVASLGGDGAFTRGKVCGKTLGAAHQVERDGQRQAKDEDAGEENHSAELGVGKGQAQEALAGTE